MTARLENSSQAMVNVAHYVLAMVVVAVVVVAVVVVVLHVSHFELVASARYSIAWHYYCCCSRSAWL